MIKVDFYEKEPQGIPFPFVVIAAQYDGKWVFVRHKKRQTYEVAGGHIEEGEDPVTAAKRELYEETGAVDFSLNLVSLYTVTTKEKTDGGYLFYADIKALSELPAYEMAERRLFHDMPDELTYPHIQPHLYRKVLEWLREM